MNWHALHFFSTSLFLCTLFREFRSGIQCSICGGVVVYWCIHSTLLLRARVRIPPSPCTFVLQQGNVSTLLLSTQVYKWRPGRMWQMIVCEFVSAIIIGWFTRQGMLPGEWKLCTVSAALKCTQWPGYNNNNALCTLGLVGKVRIKTSNYDYPHYEVIAFSNDKFEKTWVLLLSTHWETDTQIIFAFTSEFSFSRNYNLL